MCVTDIKFQPEYPHLAIANLTSRVQHGSIIIHQRPGHGLPYNAIYSTVRHAVYRSLSLLRSWRLFRRLSFRDRSWSSLDIPYIQFSKSERLYRPLTPLVVTFFAFCTEVFKKNFLIFSVPEFSHHEQSCMACL